MLSMPLNQLLLTQTSAPHPACRPVPGTWHPAGRWCPFGGLLARRGCTGAALPGCQGRPAGLGGEQPAAQLCSAAVAGLKCLLLRQRISSIATCDVRCCKLPVPVQLRVFTGHHSSPHAQNATPALLLSLLPADPAGGDGPVRRTAGLRCRPAGAATHAGHSTQWRVARLGCLCRPASWGARGEELGVVGLVLHRWRHGRWGCICTDGRHALRPASARVFTR